jgi:two-component system KDP operon response regulator KdpE
MASDIQAGQGVRKDMASRILVVDDAPEMTMFLERILTKEGYEVAVAYDAREGLRQVHHFRPDLVLLDVMMPEVDGWHMLQHLREFSDVSVIMLTAIGQVDSKVRGLDTGADDYVTKPFEVRELKARIRAALRRAELIPSSDDYLLRFDDGRLIIDPSCHQVTVRSEVVDLTPTEYKLLLYLAYNAGQVLTYDQILDSVWGPGYEDSATSVKVYIRRLRQKIEVDARNPRYILTQWGTGYYLAKI